jgi:hypothetical protein
MILPFGPGFIARAPASHMTHFEGDAEVRDAFDSLNSRQQV